MKRKIMWASLALAGAVALVGGGTFALYSDTETATTDSFEAGTLDLVVTQDPVVDVENLKPGDSGVATYKLRNIGSLPLKLKVFMVKDSDADGVCTEPEGEDEATPAANQCDDDGELEEAMQAYGFDGLWFDGMGGLAPVLGGLNVGQEYELTSLAGAPTWIIAGNGGESYPPLGWHIGASADNASQGDSVSFHLRFEAEQIVP